VNGAEDGGCGRRQGVETIKAMWPATKAAVEGAVHGLGSAELR
jgi:hypothetical protein